MSILALIETAKGGELQATEQLFTAMGQEGVEITSYPLTPLKNTGMFPFLSWIVRSTVRSAHLSFINRSCPFVYSTTYLGVLGALLVRPFTNQRVIFHYHGSRIPDQPTADLSSLKQLSQSLKRRLVVLLHHFCLRKVDLFCVPSVAVLESLRKEFSNTHIRKTALVPNGVNLNTFHAVQDGQRSELRKQFHIPKNSFVCLIISRMNAAKRIIESVEFVEALQRYSRRQALVLVAFPDQGNDADYVEKVQQRLRHFEVPHLAIQAHQHIEHLYQLSDCVISHSEREVFPLALLEAAACGIPYFAVHNGTTETYLEQIDPDLILPSSAQQAARQVLAGTHRQKLLEKMRTFAASHSWKASAVILHQALLKLS